VIECAMDVTAAGARTERWERWRQAFWKGVGAELGDAGTDDLYKRKYGDVWVLVDFISDDGLLNIAVVDAADVVPGAITRGPSLTVMWDQSDAREVVDAVLENVRKVRADPIFRVRHRREGQT